MSQNLLNQTDAFERPLATIGRSGSWHLVVPSVKLEAHKSLGIRIQNISIVLYRKKDGLPVALEDRCPHRWAPLSGGRIDGDNIVCPYHGFKFCPSGHLVDDSGKSDSPGIGTAQVYQVKEQNSRIWVWLDDGPTRPDVS